MKKRIACITEHTSLIGGSLNVDDAGQHAYVSELMVQLADQGWEVDVFTPRINSYDAEITQIKPGIRVIQIESAQGALTNETDLQYIDVFSSAIKDFAFQKKLVYDLIHANYYTAGLIAIELKRKFKAPFIFTFHELGKVLKIESGAEEISDTRLEIEQLITKKADLIVVECPQDKADLIQYYDVSSKKTFIIPAGFNSDRFFPIEKAEARRFLNLPLDEKILLHAGSFAPQKGIDNVIKSLALLNASKQNIRLIVLGLEEKSFDLRNNDELERLRRLAEDLGLAKQINFETGMQRETLQYYYAAADLFVNTPVFNGLGMTQLHAMACGTPVIGSEVGAIKFAVVDGKTGFIIPPKAPALLADRIRLVIENEALLNQMSRDSVRHVYSSFTWDKVADQMIDLYEYALLTKANKLTKAHKNDIAKATSIKNISPAIPLRNLYLKRNMQSKYGN
jgi:D-inositol-3-phosphate glycosyltransferase